MVSNSFVPESISIKNFNNISQLHVNFPDILVITGKNGSGKSSTIDAFFYCITGQTIRNVQVADIIKKGEKSTIIKVVGTYNDDRVEITRTRTATTQKLSVLIGDDKKEHPNPKEFLDSIVTPSEFVNLFLIDGHDIARFVSIGSKEMSANIDKMFNFGKLDTMIKETGQSISRFEKDLNIIGAKIETLQAKKESSIRMAKITGKNVFEERLISASKLLAGLQPESKNLSSKMSAIREKIKERMAIIESARLLYTQKANLENSIEILDKNITINNDRLEALKRDFDSRGGAKKIADLGKEIADFRQSVAAATAEFAARRDFPALIKKAMEASPDGTDCPMCATPGARSAAEKNFGVIAENNKEMLATLLSKKVNAQKAITEKEATMNELTAIRSSIQLEDQQLRGAMVLRDRDATSLKTLLERAPPGSVTAATELAELEKESSEISGNIAKVNAEIHTATRDIEDARRSINEINAASVEEWNADKESELTGLQSEKDRFRERIDKLVLFKGICRDVLSNIRDRIMSTLTPNVMDCIKNFGGGESAITKFAILPKPKNVKGEQIYYYDFAVEVAGNDVVFDALSTGQKALVIISIILSMINYSSSALSCIFFDEIDNCGLDRNYMQTILKAIVKMTETIKIVFVNRDKSTIDSLSAICGTKNVRASVVQMPDPVAPKLVA